MDLGIYESELTSPEIIHATYPSLWGAVWVAEFSSGDAFSTMVEGARAPGMSYAAFIGYVASGRHICRGECIRLYARNVDLGLM